MDLSAKCWIICSPGTCLGQYRHFLINAWANTPTFFNSTNPCKTQKPESNTTTLPALRIGHVRCSKVPTVLPLSSFSLLPKCCGQFFPSLSSTCQIISPSAQPASWYSLPKGHGFLGTNIEPGQVYSFTQLDIDLSITLIQEGKKFSAMF